MLRRLSFVCLLLPAGTLAQSPAPLSADEIMHRVALNQDRSETERTHFLYVQHARILSREGRTIRCEETTDTRITPTPTGSTRQLLKLDGRLLLKGKYVTYTEPTTPPPPEGTHASVTVTDDSMDRDLVETMRTDLTDKHTRDGLAPDLFPLTTANQALYRFRLLGQGITNGHTTFHIAFEPRPHADADWKGEAFIDTAAFEPVLIRTTLAHKVPFAVRTMLGTNVPGLGFAVTYLPEPSSGLWFPSSLGTEFKIRVLFFFHREIIFNAENRDFERTHVTSTIVPTTP